MLILKQSTAVDVAFGPFLDETDGFTAETALTLTQPDIRLSKNGAAFAQKSAAQTLSHMENGYYSLNLSTTDTNTVGHLLVHSKESGALPVWQECYVVEEAIYDALFGASAVGELQVDVRKWIGQAVAAVTNNGVPEVDVTHWLGTAAATPTVAGVPEVDLTHVAGSTTSVSTLASSVATLLAAIGAINDAAAADDPTNADTAMAYLKQLVNILVGSAGVATFPASATPGNAVSLAEVIRQIYDEVAGLDGSAIPSASANATAVWASGTRTLTALGFTLGASDLAADTITAAKIAADAITSSELATSAVDEIVAGVWAAAARTLTASLDPDAATIVAAILAAAFEGTESVQDFLRLARAALYGVSEDMDTATGTYMAADETTPRIVATLDGAGNRTAVTLDPDS